MMENNKETAQSPQRPLTLHHLSDSQSLRILWALEELTASNQLQSAYTLKSYQRIKARAPRELQSVFPLGKCPILEVDSLPGSTDQEKIVITESRLILQYLADNYTDGTWTPTDYDSKRRNDFWQEFAGTTLNPAIDFVLVFDIIPPNVPWLVRPLASAVFSPLAGMYRKDLARPFALMEAALSEEYPWFAGRNLGLADFCMSWPIDKATQRGYLDAGMYPKVAEWLERVHERPAYRKALNIGGTYDLVTFGYGR